VDILDKDILNLWKCLAENQVAYLMVGGFATNFHGYSRMTNDVDIWIKDSTENRKKFRKSLKDAEIGDFESIETLEFIPGWTTIYLNQNIELDVMSYLKGFPQERFDECFELASEAEIHGIKVRFLHINHLLEAKKASNRLQDQIDIEELKKIIKDK
jgi:predicted nucleotidyltransferase